jgi:surface protein
MIKPRYSYIVPKTKEELQSLIQEAIKEQGNNADLNFIDTYDITDMSTLFLKSKFNGDISKWDVSNVENMSYMFYDSKFEGDIYYWNFYSVNNKINMFSGCPLEIEFGKDGENL